MEHITTSDGVEVVRSFPGRLGATITPQHLLYNRNALFHGGLRPHVYCLPVLKREVHRLALRVAATSGEASFFLGTDTAPHLQHLKEAACGCAGVFSAPVAIQAYLRVFAEENALDKFEGAGVLRPPAQPGESHLCETCINGCHRHRRTRGGKDHLSDGRRKRGLVRSMKR